MLDVVILPHPLQNASGRFLLLELVDPRHARLGRHIPVVVPPLAAEISSIPRIRRNADTWAEDGVADLQHQVVA